MPRPRQRSQLKFYDHQLHLQEHITCPLEKPALVRKLSRKARRNQQKERDRQSLLPIWVPAVVQHCNQPEWRRTPSYRKTSMRFTTEAFGPPGESLSPRRLNRGLRVILDWRLRYRTSKSTMTRQHNFLIGL